MKKKAKTETGKRRYYNFLPEPCSTGCTHTQPHTHAHKPGLIKEIETRRSGTGRGVARRIGKSAAQNKLKQVENKFEKINEIKRRNQRKKDKVKSEKRTRANGAHKRGTGRRVKGEREAPRSVCRAFVNPLKLFKLRPKLTNDTRDETADWLRSLQGKDGAEQGEGEGERGKGEGERE